MFGWELSKFVPLLPCFIDSSLMCRDIAERLSGLETFLRRRFSSLQIENGEDSKTLHHSFHNREIRSTETGRFDSELFLCSTAKLSRRRFRGFILLYYGVVSN